MASQKSLVTFTVNGEQREVPVTPNETLLAVLREDLGLTGTNHGCELGECGACTVLVDDEPTLSCLTLAQRVDGQTVETVEGLGDGGASDLQEAFVDEGAAQCGYCTPGMLMTADHLLDTNPDPSREEVEDAIAGNICRCTGYEKIVDAIETAADDTGD